jgi:hypothetical protein
MSIVNVATAAELKAALANVGEEALDIVVTNSIDVTSGEITGFNVTGGVVTITLNEGVEIKGVKGVFNQTAGSLTFNGTGTIATTTSNSNAAIYTSNTGTVLNIDGITIDGETYLTYPVKAIASVRSGSFGLSALAVGGKVAYKTITKQIPGSLTVQKFSISGGKICYAGQAEYLDYELIDSTGSRITDFEAVVKLTIQRDAANEVYISIPNTVINSTVAQNGVAASTNSYFFWEKDMETGKAKLKYFPVTIGTDTIVTLPGNATATTTTTNVIVMVTQ